jgi:cysteinyl-tRNA synthetase
MINSIKDGSRSIDSQNLDLLAKTMNSMIFEVLGFVKEGKSDSSDGLTDSLMEMIIKMRVSAKENKDYALADKIRDELTARNVQLKDSNEGTTWTHEN